MAIPGTHSTRISASTPARFGIALLVTLLALLIARTMKALPGGLSQYLMALAAVAFSTWFCGTGPAIASLSLLLLTIDFWLIPPTRSLQTLYITDWVNLLMLLIGAIVIV